MRVLFYIMAFSSGFSGLVYEILWNRQLLLLFGSTTQSAVIILAAFFGGIGIGSLLIIRYVNRIPSPLYTYITLECFIVFSAIAFYWYTGFVSNNIYMTAGHAPFQATQIYVAEIVLLLFPTIAMGASLPMLVHSFRLVFGSSSSSPALFYGFNTLGAVSGAILAGFYFIPNFGMQGTLIAAISGNFLAVLIGAGICHNLGSKIWNIVKTANRGIVKNSEAVFAFILFIGGIASLGYEILWTRILILIIGSSTYAFTVTVAIFVLGTSLGSLYISRRVHKLQSTLLAFIHTQIGIGLLAILGIYLYGELPYLYLNLFAGEGSYLQTVLSKVFLTVIIMLPPALLIGASFPLAVALVQRTLENQGKAFAFVFGWISSGNVFGVILTGMVLVPQLGLQQSAVVLSLTSLALAILLLLKFHSIPARLYHVLGVVSIGLALVIVLPDWNPVLMTSGVYDKAALYTQLINDEEEFKNTLMLNKLIYYEEGPETVVSVVEMPSLNNRPYYALSVDGKVDASTGDADMNTQILSGHIPFIFNREIQDLLVIGLASGITIGSAGLHSLESITCVEIEPSMILAAKKFEDFNHSILDDPRTDLVIDDGRHFILTNAKSYDLIISEPSNPWMSGPSRLFTYEFLNLAKKRLNKRGLYAQWIPLYGMGRSYFTSLIRTFLEVFPYSVSFRVSEGDLLLIGSCEAIEIETRNLNQLFLNAKIREDLNDIGIRTPAEVLGRWMGSAPSLKEFSQNTLFNTDNNGFVEFGAPKFLNSNTLSENLSLFQDRKLLKDLLDCMGGESGLSINSTLLVELAEHALQTKNYNKAEILAESLREQHKYTSAQYIKARVAEAEFDLVGAMNLYEEIWQSDPTFDKVLWRLLPIYYMLKRLKVAENLLTKIPNDYRGSDYYYWQGMIHLTHNHPQLALSNFSKIKDELKNIPETTFHIYHHVAARRSGDSDLQAQTEFMVRLNLQTLRQEAEMNRKLDQIEALLDQFNPDKLTFLTHKEQLVVNDLIMRELLLPLNMYNQGVNFMLRGKLNEARNTFEQVVTDLGQKDTATRAKYFANLLNTMEEKIN